jgi:plasmid maintenance system antidote protein VapI
MKNVGQELLTRLQTQYQAPSLRALHHVLCVSPQNLYQIDKGQRHMATDTILIACDCLGIDPRPWLIQAEIDVCKTPQRRQILTRILHDLDSTATRAVTGCVAFLLMGWGGGFPL